MSQIEADAPTGPFDGTRKALSSLGVDVSTVSEAQLLVVHRVCELVGTRAARLSATALAAVVEQTGNDQTNGDIHVGVDGSLVELYPHFHERLRIALKEILGESNEARVKIGLSKDGSGAGGESFRFLRRDQTLKRSRQLVWRPCKLRNSWRPEVFLQINKGDEERGRRSHI
jgi:hexokinase